MTTATPSTALATIQPAFTDPERLALAGFLAGYRGLTREAYTLDLRQFATWCRTRSLPLFAVRRADIEGFARDLEGKGRARATVTRRLSTIAGFYNYAVEEELLDHSPAAHARRPGWITSLVPPPWTATSSARCWWPPGSGHRRACADLSARAERAPGLRGDRR
jgi:integrase